MIFASLRTAAVAAVLAFLAAAAAAAEGTPAAPASGPRLRIVDATRAGDPALRRCALLFSLRENLPVGIDRGGAADALAKLDAGEADLAILPAAEFPAGASGWYRSRFYAAEALICCVAPENPLPKISRKELRSLLLAEKPDWRRLTGDAAEIHRYALSARADGAGLAEHLLGVRDLAVGITRLGSAGEVLLMLAADPAGLGVASWRPELPANVKAVAVDGVRPGEDEIRSGRYPLALRYVVVAPRNASPGVRKMLADLDSPVHDRELLDAGWLPPPPRVPGGGKGRHRQK